MNLPFNVFVLLLLATCIGAQRTSGRISSPSEAGADPSTRRSRGRVRFTVPSGVSETDLLDAVAPIEKHSESPPRKQVRPSSKPYEVKEVLDDIPNVNAKKTHKPRVITETRFEAANAPKKPLYVPLPLPEDEILPEDILANFSPQITKYSTEKVEKIPETTAKVITTPQTAKIDISTEEILPLTTNLGQSPELITSDEQQPSTENEIKKVDTTTPDVRKKTLEPLQIVTPVNDARKINRVATRNRVVSSTEASQPTLTRTRNRPIRRQDVDSSEVSPVSATSSRVRPRSRQQQEKSIDTSPAPARQLRPKAIRRRLDNPETALGGGRSKVPSLFSDEDTQDDTLKTRTGRKVNYASTPENDSVQNEEKKYSQRRRPAHVKDRASNSIESTTIKGEQSNNRDVSRSYRSRSSGRNSNRNRERTTEAQQIDEAPVLNRRSSIRGRKPLVRYVAIEPVKVEKVTRTRGNNTTEKATTIKEEPSKTKTTQIENETTPLTTTSPPTTKSRRIDNQPRIKPQLQSESKIEENVVSTTSQNPSTIENRRSSLRGRVGSRRTKAPPSDDDTTKSPQVTTSRNDVRRRSFSKRVNTVEPTVKEPTKEINRNHRQRTRYIPPIIDEQKLEVLPLFESESKTVPPIIKRRPNSESMNAASSSEHQVKVGAINEIKIDAPVRIETKTEKSERVQHIRTVQPTKQSIETKVSEVVTKRKIGRQVVRKVKVNKTNDNNISGEREKSNESNDAERKPVKITAVPLKNNRRLEISKANRVPSNLSSSEEDIGDSDNYPEPFRALIQAKLATQSGKKGSRSQQKSASEDKVTKSTERIVTSSRTVPIIPSTATTVRSTTTSTEAPKTTFSKPNDADNELFPHTTATETARPTRRRFSLTTKAPEITEDVSTKYTKRPLFLVRKVVRSTIAPSDVSVVTEVSAKVKKQQRYHARFSASGKNEERGIEKSTSAVQNLEKSLKSDPEVVSSTARARSYSPKPPRGLYSTRKGGKKRAGKQESSVSAQVTNEGKKSGRYSARYRSDIFSRAGSTRPTSAPAYIPTVPTVTTPSVSAPAGIEDYISGMEVISIDEPVNTIPSDSLINGELLSNPNPPFSNHPPTKLIPASLVTKDEPATVTKATPPVSIIERIIYSITAISTASPDSNTDLTNDGPTKSSAILKIPSKTTKGDVTFNVLSQHKAQQPETVTTNEIIRPLTTERPTTIIERILSSISAIQASSTTERTQVGNTLSSVSTNPLSKDLRGVTASVSSTTISTSLSSSTTPSPALDAIEELSSEQALQQRTIAKLLALLKSITPNTSSTEDEVVVVTPKSKVSSPTPDDVEVFDTSSNLNPAIPERSSTETPQNVEITPIPETTTPDVAQNTIAQNTAGTESPTSIPNPAINLSSRLLDTVSISDFIATLDTLNNMEATTPSASNTQNNNENAIIESTTPSLTIESTTAIPPSTIEAVPTTTIATANLVTEASSSTNLSAVDSSTEPAIISTGTPTVEVASTAKLDDATQGGASTDLNVSTAANLDANATPANVENSTPAILERLAVDVQGGGTTEVNVVTSTSDATKLDSNATVGVEQNPANVENSTPPILESLAQGGVSTEVNAVTSTSIAANLDSSTTPANIENSTPAILERLAVDVQGDTSTEVNAVTSTSIATNLDSNTTPANIENSTPAITESLAIQGGTTEVTSRSGDANLDSNTTPGVEQNPTNVDTSKLLAINGRGSASVELNAAISTSITADITNKGATITIQDSNATSEGERNSADVQSSTPAISERLADVDGGTNIETTTVQDTITTDAPSTTPNPTTIFAMLSRLLELADRAQTLTTLTLEQTTVSTIPESSSGTTSLPTLTTLGNFEVSPGSVTIFSANDLTSMPNISVDDGTTITISSRSFLTTSAPSTEASITETVPPTNPIITTILPSSNVDDNSGTSVNSSISSADDSVTTTVSSVDSSADLVASTIAPSDNPADVVVTTIVPPDITTLVAEIESTSPDVTTTIEPSSTNNNNSSLSMSTSTNVTNAITQQENASNVTVSERAGRVLALPEEVVRNDIQTSSEPPDKDFYIFGILPNNTILRKRPSMYPNKNTPFIIVGVYPNNTVIQKFPNGTQIPPEPVIQAIAPRIAETGQPQTETNAAPSTLPPPTTAVPAVVTTTPPPIITTTLAPVVTTTGPPPVGTTTPLVAESDGQPTTTVKDAKNGDGARDVEEINIEENTISNNNGNTKLEKVVERTTTQSTPQTTATISPPTTTIKPNSIATTEIPNQQITESAVQTTTILAAIRIEDLADQETTLPAMDVTTIVPDVANRFGVTEISNPTTEAIINPTSLRYTNTATTVMPPSEILQLAIRPTTPYLIQRIIGNVTGIPVRVGGQPTNLPISTIPTEAVPTTRFPMRSRFITTIPRAMTAPTTVQGPTTEIPTTTIRNRGRSRYTLFVPNDSRTVTVTPTTITTEQYGFDDFPIRTTYTPRRFTQTPATINIPSKIATFTPTNIPTVTEQNFLSTTILGLQNAPLESSTVFPIYTSAFEFTTETPSGITQQEVTTNTPPTFASTVRQRQRTTPFSISTTREDLEKLVELRVRNNFGELSTGGDYYNPTTVSSQISTTAAATLQTSLKSVNGKVKQLTEQQIKDLEELAKLEKEQQAILQQLAFLTRLAGGTPKPTRSNSNNNLAGRVLDFAADRNKQSTTQNPSNLLQALTNQNPKQVESKSPSLEEILKQFNVNPNAVTVSPLTSTYGKSTDAILAALLKERGIEPSTPKTLGELDELRTTTPSTTTGKAVTTRKRVTTTTTARPGPIMQGLNWLLNRFAPAPTTKKPQTRKTAPTTRTTPKDLQVISSQPTEITPVVVTAPPRTRSASTAKRGSSRYRKPLHSLSEDELKNLVGQLEDAQKDPSKAKDIDFSTLGYASPSSSKPTNLLPNNAVQIINSGNVGTTSKVRAAVDSSAKEAEVVPLVFNRGRSTTAIPASVSNSIADDADEDTTTVKQRRLPPVQLNPVPGIDAEDGTQVRGQLINAAVNVTRAISQFLGSAIQGAAQSFQSFIGSGSRQVGNYFASSSISSNRPG